MIALLLSLALPAQAAWSDIGSKYDCTFSKQDEGAVVALRAQCTWTVPYEKVEAVLADWESHDEVFASVASSKLLAPLQGGKGRVHQVHQASGISDREVVMDVAEVAVDGGKRWTHNKAADQSALSGENVEVGRDDGLWELKRTDTGCTLLYELRYDAAGSVPGFMVKWFQGSGFKEMLGEVRAYALAH